jgi:putative DNA primase/helicase
MTPSPTVARILERLEGAKANGSGWMARCVGHDDKHASLSIGQGDDGRALLKCHAGCETTDVVARLGLAERDLFPAREPTQKRGRIVATYTYEAETGAALFEVVRFDPRDFRQRRSNAAGGWTWNLKNTRRVLYRLPCVLAAAKAGGVVDVVEGERDVEGLERLKPTATCSEPTLGTRYSTRPYYPLYATCKTGF